MSHDQGTILVLGATGTQGGAVASELLRRGWPVRALVRNPDSEKAQALSAAGVEVVKGDMDNHASLDDAMKGAYGVFSVQTFTGPEGVAGEERQGRAVADAAARAKISHFVYGSVGGAGKLTGVPHFDSKHRIEKYIEELGLPATFLRPALFISGFTFMGPTPAESGQVLSLTLKPNTVLQMIDPRDIGLFAADALEDPATYIGAKLELAGDALTGPAMAQAFQRVSGAPTTFQQQDRSVLASFSEEMALMFDWFNAVGFSADVVALRKLHPEMATLESWACEEWTPPAS